jgi:hypothetical protein
MSHNPLEEYRRIQRQIRKDFDAFTSVYCPVCPTPCCVRPARIAPTDILLAEAVGWKAQVAAHEQRDLVQEAAGQAALALGGTFEGVENPPCEHLGERGCTFPKDLRPFGCTAYICPIMHRELDKKTLNRMKRLVKELTLAHERLMVYVHRRCLPPEEDTTAPSIPRHEG